MTDDRKPRPTPEPPALDGKGQSLASILGLEEAIPTGRSVHEQMADQIKAITGPPVPNVQRGIYLDDSQLAVATWLRERTGRELGFGATWIRFVRPDLGRSVVFIVHNPHRDGEAELTVLADRGVLSRGAIRDACRWAFWGLGLWRLTTRIPANRSDLADLARRAGFKFEGTARLFFGGTLDAQVWAMCGPECRWLPQAAPAISTTDTSPPSSLKVH